MDPEIVEAQIGAMGNSKGQVLKADGVAKSALYLASDEADYVSGVSLVLFLVVLNKCINNTVELTCSLYE